MNKLTVLGISGSLRTGSTNSRLLREAVRLAPDGIKVDVYGGLPALPPFNQDQEDDPPAPVADLRARVAAADALLIATPEYNYGVPGVLKNALDWASRPSGRGVLTGKPVALMGAAATPQGSARAQHALRQSFVWTDTPTVNKPEVLLGRSYEAFDQDGRLTDAATADLVRQLLESLRALVARHRTP